MKIAILQDDFPPRHAGGAGVIAHALAGELYRRGHDVLVITAVRGRDQEGVSAAEGYPVHSVASSYPPALRAWVSLWNPRTTRQVRRILAEFKPDVVHAHNLHAHLSYRSLAIAKKAGARVFLTAHDAMLFHYGKIVGAGRISAWSQFKANTKRYNPFRNAAIRHYLSYTDRIFAVSAALKRELGQNGISGVEVLHNGIMLEEWEADTGATAAFKERFGLNGKKVIMFGGRLGALKGGEQAVRALAEVLKKVPEALLLVVGEKNAYAEKMVDLAHSLGVGHRMVFTGWISGRELRAAYYAADAVAVLSIYMDPFPTVNLEAMACKKPIVGTCFGGTPEIIVDGVTGYIVDPRDIRVLSERFIELLSRFDLAEKLGAAGYARVMEGFSLSAQTGRLLGRYSI